MDSHVAGHRDRRLRDRRGRARRRGPDRAVHAAPRWCCNTVGPFSKLGPAVVEACLAAGVALHRHHRRAGLADHLRREVRRRLRRRRPAARARASRRCTPPARSPPSSASSSPASTPSTSRCSGAAARRSPRPGRSWSTPRTSEAHYLEQNEYVAVGPRGRASYQLVDPRPARARARRCRGAARRTRSGSSATRGSPTSRRWAACSTGADDRRTRRSSAAAARGDQGHGARRTATPR